MYEGKNLMSNNDIHGVIEVGISDTDSIIAAIEDGYEVKADSREESMKRENFVPLRDEVKTVMKSIVRDSILHEVKELSNKISEGLLSHFGVDIYFSFSEKRFYLTELPDVFIYEHPQLYKWACEQSQYDWEKK